MTTAIPTQAQVDEIARKLGPDVVSIRLDATEDFSGKPALYFKVVLTDEASRGARLRNASRAVRDTLDSGLNLSESERFPYFRFRNQSEQAQMKDSSWD